MSSSPMTMQFSMQFSLPKWGFLRGQIIPFFGMCAGVFRRSSAPMPGYEVLAPLAMGPSVGHMGSSSVSTHTYAFKQCPMDTRLAQPAMHAMHRRRTDGHRFGV